MQKNRIRHMIFIGMLGCLEMIGFGQQISIQCINQMPQIPKPYVMRNWADVTRKYDSLVYNIHATGLNWPIVTLGKSGINYPAIQPIFMDSYVGAASHGTEAEAINILPSLVGATLTGANKSNQYGVDWVASSKDFFNKKNGQNVYLNNTSATSGSDWWYDIMPNVYFYQLYSLYPNEPDLNTQFITVANVWQNAVSHMGGSSTPWTIPNMNYRAWNLASQTPLATGVIEPEAAGSLSWILYNAYKQTGNKSYLYTSQQCMDFLNSLTSDPSYEIQLPYGALTAARMNAELGSNYDINKMVNWIFNEGPLRDWGTISGNWFGYDVSGLVGDEEPGSNYVFLMNGFQQTGTLVPLVKYDKRFACAIAKWTLNLANACRLYYTHFLPDSNHCDSYDWSIKYDTNCVIGHEALSESWNGISLYAKGDAIAGGWASTDLGLYSSSSVSYLGSILDTTNVTGILSLDLDKTDFYGNTTYPSRLIYNPTQTVQNVNLNLGTNNYDIYDAISEKVILFGATGTPGIPLLADSACLLVYLPHGTVLSPKNGKLYAGSNIVDYHYQSNFSGQFRIKAIVAKKDSVLTNTIDSVYCTVDNAPSTVVYHWSANGGSIPLDTGSILKWLSPLSAGAYMLTCTASSGGFEATDSVLINAVSVIPAPPVIISLQGNKRFYYINDTLQVYCNARDPNGSALTYAWKIDTLTQLTSDSASIRWILADTAGIYTINCKVTNTFGLSSKDSIYVLVKLPLQGNANPLIYYPFDGNVNDYSGNGYNAVLNGAVPTTDALGRVNRAYEFSNPADVIYTPNQPALNFQDKITMSFWVRLDQVPAESYVISHGSWQDRYKVSVLPGNTLRWTIKTNMATLDLDDSTNLALNTYYHYTVVYTGYSMEIYKNGYLDVFKPLTGKIQQTSQDITIGQELLNQTSYTLYGAVDEVRIYDNELSMDQIKTLPTLWNVSSEINTTDQAGFRFFPNPSSGMVYFNLPQSENLVNLEAFDITGRKLSVVTKELTSQLITVEINNPYHGLVVFKIQCLHNQYFCKVLFL